MARSEGGGAALMLEEVGVGPGSFSLVLATARWLSAGHSCAGGPFWAPLGA